MATREEVFQAYLDRGQLVSGGTVPASWTGEGGLWIVEGEPEETKILRIDLGSGDAVPAVDVRAVRRALATATGHEPPYNGLPFERLSPVGDGRVQFDYAGERWLFNPADGTVARSGVETEKPTAQIWKGRVFPYLVDLEDLWEVPSPTGEWFASIRDNNLILRSMQDGRVHQLTADGTPDCYWDLHGPYLTDTRPFATPWSQDGLILLAFRRDMSGVFRMPRVNWLKPFEDVDFIPYQKAGARLDRIEPLFIEARSGRQTPIDIGEVEDRYLFFLGWHLSGAEAVLLVYTRDFKCVEIVAAARETGSVRTILGETAETFVRIQHDAFTVRHGFNMLPDGSGFLWLSTRSGWNHVYRYDWDGVLVAELTSGEFPVREISHIGADGFLYFTAAVDSERPYDVHVCRVPLTGGTLEPLTREKGIHRPVFAPEGEAFLDTHSTVDRPQRTDLVRADGTLLRTVSKMDISRLEAVGYTPPDEFTVKAADGVTDLWGVMYKPFDFDPSVAYPVLEYIYAGPQTITAQRHFAVDPDGYHHPVWALAQLGYIVVCLDARGTPGRSKAFQDFIYGNWAAGVVDHIAGMRQLCERHKWMDAARVGIFGHSWGGYFSACSMIEAPDVYHASVSSAPGPDPWDMIIWEPYLDLPSRNRGAYDRANLISQAGKVKGRLMLVVGTSDHANINTTFRLTRALIDEGIDHEFVALPGAGHIFHGKDRDYYLSKLIDWFDRHVKHREGTSK